MRLKEQVKGISRQLSSPGAEEIYSWQWCGGGGPGRRPTDDKDLRRKNISLLRCETGDS